MENLNQHIEAHYFKEGIYEEILRRLTAQQLDVNRVKRSDISGIDELHVRGASVSHELANSIDLKGLSVLDVGSGLGGACRMLADEFNCRTIGIDLSPEFVRTAKELSKLVHLDDRTSFVKGDATILPFGDNAFDVVWTQHVQMNIPDKRKFYAGINRVLKPGGHFLYYDIFRKTDGEVQYPMPWAGSRELSFLFETREMEKILADLALQKISSIDQTPAGIAFFEIFFAKLEASGPPNMGLHLLRNESSKAQFINLLAHLQKGVLQLESGVYKK